MEKKGIGLEGEIRGVVSGIVLLKNGGEKITRDGEGREERYPRDVGKENL